jgi:hypothetical protein
MYSLYKLTKITFYVSDKIGILYYIKNHIICNNAELVILVFDHHECKLTNPVIDDYQIGTCTFNDDYILITKM